MLKNNFIILSLLIFIGISAFPLHAADKTRELSSKDIPYALGKYIYLFQDASKNLTIDDIIKPGISQQFVSSSEWFPNFGFSNAAYWARFTLTNAHNSEANWAFVSWIFILEELELFIPQKNHTFLKKKGGIFQPAADRDLKLNYPIVFYLTLKPGETKTYYVRIATNYFSRMNFWVSSHNALIIALMRAKVFSAGYIFFIVALLLYNLFLFLSVKNRRYLYFILYVVSILLSSLVFEGFFSELFNAIGANSLVIIPTLFTILQVFFALLFSLFFLNLNNFSRSLTFFVISLMAGQLIALALFIFLPLHFVYGFYSIYGVCCYCAILLLSFYCRHKGLISARLFSIAWLFVIIGNILQNLGDLAILPGYPVLGLVFKLSVTLGTLLLSLALSERIKIIKKEREKAQELAIENLKKADLIKNEFLANTSHELKTPLNGIIGMAEALASNSSSTLDEITKKNLRMIIASGKRLANLINDILDFSRLKNLDLTLYKKPIGIHAMIDAVFYLLKPLVNNAISLVNDVPENFPLIDADEDRLQQILINLIGNAIKFTEQGAITVSAISSGNMATICISDTGIGIPRDKFSAIFKSFEQGDGSISREYGGSGLGLAITKKLVELHNGAIWVASEQGTGSQFYFTMPLSKNEHQAIITQGMLPEFQLTSPSESVSYAVKDIIKPGAIYTVLVVDDEPINLQVFANQLKTLNLNIKTATNGKDALHQSLELDKPDCIILDIMMPVMSGYEVCSHIRKRYSMDELPILMVTAKNRTEDMIAGFNVGANDFLTKPYERDELIYRVENLLSLLKAKRSKDQAIKEERDKIYGDIHDHLGGKLTDLKFLAEKISSSARIDPALSQELSENVNQSINALKERLLNIEDLKQLSEDFFMGLQFILLRRYTNAGRTLSYEAVDIAAIMDADNTHIRTALFSVCNEIATNDIKYGLNQSSWLFSQSGNKITLSVHCDSKYNMAETGSGRGTGNIYRRIHELGGSVDMVLKDNTFNIVMSVLLQL